MNPGLATRLAVAFVAVSGIVIIAFAWLTARRAELVLKDELGEKLASIAESASANPRVAGVQYVIRAGGGAIAAAAREELKSLVRNFGIGNLIVAGRNAAGELEVVTDASGRYGWKSTPWTWHVADAELDRVWQGKVVYTPMYTGEDGEQYLSAYAPLRVGGAVRLVVGAEASAKFLKRVRSLRRYYTGAGLFMILLAAVLGSLTARTITRPLRQLTVAAQRLEGGDYTVTTNVDAGAEVGDLARAFNRMARMINVRRELLLENMSNGLIAVEPGGTVSEVNRAAEEVLALRRDRLTGRACREALPAGLAQALEETLAGDEPLRGEKIGVDAPVGGRRILQVSTSLLMDADGSPRGAEVSFLDVTEIERLTDALESQRRFAAIGEMAAEVAHQIRNPLASIRGFADLLHADLEAGGTSREYLADLVKEVRTTEGIVTNFLALTRPSRLELGPVVLGETVAAAVRGMRPEFEAAGVALDTELGTALPVVRADGKAVAQALGNLLRNALEACRRGNRVVVRAGSSNGDGPAGVYVMVEDDGAGIAPEILPKLFTPFVTNKAQGTGLGLSLARKFVEAHGGTVALAPLPRGTRAEIRLPVEPVAVL